VVQLLSLQPGVTPSGEVLGARRDQNNVTLDGVDVNDNQNSGIFVNHNQNDGQGSNANGASPVSGFNSVLPIPLDSVQEFRVTVAGQGAENADPSKIAGEVADNPSLVPNSPFIENLFPVSHQLLHSRQRDRELFLRDLRSVWRQLSGHPACAGPHPRSVRYSAGHLCVALCLLHVPQRVFLPE
jgi:hypothetical protein